MMPENKIYDILKTTELFSGLDRVKFEGMLKKCEYTTWNKSEAIENGDGLKYLNIILSGDIKLTQIDPKSGRSIVLFLLHKGDIFDLLALLDGESHISFPVAITKVNALRVKMEDAREWLEKFPEFNKRFLPYIGKHMRALEEFGENMVFDDTATRLAKLILKYATPKDEDEECPVKLINNLSHDMIAQMIGSVRSVVTSQIQKLKKDEMIIRERGYMAIKKLEDLKEKYNL